MSCFFWNVRGLNKSTKHSVIKKWVEEQNFQFGCILETRVQESKMQTVGNQIFKDWSILTNYEHNRRGRIWVVWRNNTRLSPIYKSGQLITCSVKLEGQEDEFFCSFLYVSNFASERKDLWNDLRDHCDSPIIRNKPWIIFGDFNEILNMAEHSKGDDTRVTYGMREFQEMVNYCAFTDLSSHGSLYTWSNRQENDLILKKLDRVLVNNKWKMSFPQSYNVFEAGGCSDHLRCRINLNIDVGERVKGKKPFKFINAIAEMQEFRPMVEAYWKTTEPVYMSTSTMFRFTKKLKALKPKIRQLAKEKMGNLVKRTKEAHDTLCQKQEENLKSPSPQAMIEETEAHEKWELLAEIEEKYLKQKSKLHWMQVGDKNNKTFHRAVMARVAHNSIREIQRQDGSVTKKGEEIQEEAELFSVSFCSWFQMTLRELHWRNFKFCYHLGVQQRIEVD